MYGHMLVLAVLAVLVTAIPVDDISPGEHIQRVTMPPPYTSTDSNSRIQRVLSRRITPSESTVNTNPTPKSPEAWEESSSTGTPSTAYSTSEDETTTDLSFTVEEDGGLPEPRESSADMREDDLVTANFFWGFGLGPVYPHLYQFKRVPHLVPIHSWNPYHDYYVYHQKYPNVYKF